VGGLIPALTRESRAPDQRPKTREESGRRAAAGGFWGALRAGSPDPRGVEGLDLTVMMKGGETVPPEDLRSKIFRIADPDELSAYVVRSMETTGEGATLCYV
jgi:hypothetical protein